MKKIFSCITALVLAFSVALAQEGEEETLLLSLEDVLKIALSENVSVKVADREVERTGYARKGTYASLFPQIDASASYQRTIKKQVMYMDFNLGGMSSSSESADNPAPTPGKTSGGGIEVGRWNAFTGGISASMPLVNAQLWKSISISGQDVELAVEKARASRLDMVTQVKQAFFSVLLQKELLSMYLEVYDNAVENLKRTEMKYNAQKASELDYTRAKANVSNAIPNVFESQSGVYIALWQLKAVMGIDLEKNIDVQGALMDYSGQMFRDIHENKEADLNNNSTMKQLAIQAEQLANTIDLQKAAYLPSLALAFTYNMNAMTNDLNFSAFNWSPYSYLGLSLSIPIFSGGKRLNNGRQTKVQAAELQLQTENTRRQLQIAIRQYLNQMETAMKSFSAAEDGVDMAHKAYDIAERSYQVGRSTLTDLNDAQLSVVQAEMARSQAVYSFLLAKANLEQTLGKDFIEE